MSKINKILLIVFILDLIGISYLIFFKKNDNTNLDDNTKIIDKDTSKTYNYGGVTFKINKENINLDSEINEELSIEINGICNYKNGMDYEIRLKDKYEVNSKEIMFKVIDLKIGELSINNNVLINNKIKYNESINETINFKISINKDNLEEEDINYLKNNKLNVVFEIKGTELTPNMIDILKEKAVMDNIGSEFVTSSSGINFLAPSSDTNGKGLYIRSGTENDPYPILYYRGAVDNNYLEFAGYLWRIVRTTDTGGIKIVYEDILERSKSSPSRSSFSDGHTLPVDNGYMYGKVYQWGKGEGGSNKPGDTVTYSNGTYTITDSGNKGGYGYYVYDNKNHTAVRYYYCNYEFNKGEYGAYFTLRDGENIKEALENMQKGENSSEIKNSIDSWYANNLSNYANYFEDTIWCNDRSANVDGPSRYTSNAFDPNLGDGHGRIVYGGFGRVKYGGKPSLECRKIDAFTVNETNKGNGKLTYPVALLTSDELNLAGAVFDKKSTIYIQSTWTLSPYYFAQDVTRNIALEGSKLNELYPTSQKYYVKPSVSLKLGTMLTGTGTKQDPYKIVQ